MMLLRISSIGALFLVLTHPTEGAKLAGTDLSLETRPILETRSESLEGCGMSSLSKCYGILPPDGSTSSNLIEEIGQVSDAKKCQIFCKDLYHGTCNWFMFDRTTNDCMLFSGSLEDLQGDCREVGYAKEPNHASCDTVFPSNSSDGCYNFREDYCRFDFSLLENLDDIDSLSECQLACEYVSNCSYFLYDNPSKTCKLYTEESIQRTCDIIHGTPEPDINTCIEEGKISWAAQATVTTGQPTATDQPTEEASSTTVVPATTAMRIATNTTTSTTTEITTVPATTAYMSDGNFAGYNVLENNHAGNGGCSYPSAYPNGFVHGHRKDPKECAIICRDLGSECGGFNFRDCGGSGWCRCQFCRENDSNPANGMTAYLKKVLQ